jgi:hypothetical protein
MIMSEQSAAMNTALKRCPTTFKVTVFRKGKTKQVLFLEARKDFVDTLLSFLLLPVGTVHHILSQGKEADAEIFLRYLTCAVVGNSIERKDKFWNFICLLWPFLIQAR